MEDWKERLYDNYISTGQQSSESGAQAGLQLSDFPYFTQLIKDHLPEDKAIAIADLACGHGTLLFCLKELGYRNVQGVDISPEQVEVAHNLGLTEIVCQDLQSYLVGKEQAFDVVFLMDILEHLSRPELFDLLEQVRQSLRPNGLIVIHVPNAEGMFGMRVRYGDLTHENCFTPRSMRQALNLFGFQNIAFFEDKPPVNGVKGLFRYLTWEVLIFPMRMLLVAESGFGSIKHVLSQNMLVTAVAPPQETKN